MDMANGFFLKRWTEKSPPPTQWEERRENNSINILRPTLNASGGGANGKSISISKWQAVVRKPDTCPSVLNGMMKPKDSTRSNLAQHQTRQWATSRTRPSARRSVDGLTADINSGRTDVRLGPIPTRDSNTALASGRFIEALRSGLSGRKGKPPQAQHDRKLEDKAARNGAN